MQSTNKKVQEWLRERERGSEPVIGGRSEVRVGESFGGVGVALVVVESAAILALDGPGVSGDGAVVVGDQIGGGERHRAGLLGDVGVFRQQADSGH